MKDPTTIGNAIKAIAGGVTGVTTATLGQNMLPSTPAAEVWLDRGTLQQAAAGAQPNHTEAHAFIVAFYVPLQQNLEGDEDTIGRLATELINTIHAPAFDASLGGIVEYTRCTAYATDVMVRNGLSFRVATIDVETGIY